MGAAGEAATVEVAVGRAVMAAVERGVEIAAAGAAGEAVPA